MPVRETPPAEDQVGKVYIPDQYHKQMRQNGYDGPWWVWNTELDDLYSQYRDSGGGGGGGTSGGGTSGGGTSGGSSGGSSSGGSSGGGGMSPEARANLRASYLKILQDWGIKVTSNMNALMNRGVSRQWSTTNFIINLRRTADYRQAFPGINSGEGISEAKWLAAYDRAEELAKSYGMKLSRTQFGTLYKKDVGMEEWEMRLQFMEKVRRPGNKEYFDALQQAAKQLGIIKPKDKLTKKELFKLMTRRGHPKLEKLMEQSIVTAELNKLGFTVGEGGDVTRKMMLNFIKNVENQGGQAEMLTAQDFAELAAHVENTLPTAELLGAGLTKRDLAEMALGGPRANEIAKSVQNLLASKQLEDQPNVNPQLVEDGTGHTRLTGASPRRPTGL